MALPASGAISISQVSVELGLAGNSLRSLNDFGPRALCGLTSGSISLNALHGRQALSGTWSGSSGVYYGGGAGWYGINVSGTAFRHGQYDGTASVQKYGTWLYALKDGTFSGGQSLVSTDGGANVLGYQTSSNLIRYYFNGAAAWIPLSPATKWGPGDSMVSVWGLNTSSGLIRYYMNSSNIGPWVSIS